MDKKDKIYWHSAHHEALQLELYEYGDSLEFKKEHELYKEAPRMDTLIIKKIKNVKISKNIGKIFKNHNVVEYKSENDSFTYWDYQKVIAYAFMYSSHEKVQMSDITVSVSLTVYPRELTKILEDEQGIRVLEFSTGIYYVTVGAVPIQILESKKLPEDENLFLRNLRSNLSGEDMMKTLQSYKERKPLDDKNVFLDRLVKANPDAFKEAMSMFTEDVKEIFLEGAEMHGWLTDRDKSKEIERLKAVAKKLLLLGDSVEKIADATDLSIDTVLSIANQLEEVPAVS